MTDREKVIKGLEEISDYFFSVYRHSKDREEINNAKDRCDTVEDALALLKEQEEAKTIICPKCGDEIEIKLSLLTKPDMEAIAKRDAFLSDKNGKKLNDKMQSLW